jgi:hypothetical protein
MTAKGKINASNVTTNDRIIVNTNGGAYEGDSIRPSATKTGEGVVIVRVLDKLKVSNRRGYLIVTSAGSFYAEPIQTMWLAPEDNAGIKRALAEALELDKVYEAYPIAETAPAAEAGAAPAEPTQEPIEIGPAVDEAAAELAEAEERTENEAPGGIYHGTVWASPTPSRALLTQMVGRALRAPEPELVLDLLPPLAAGKELVRIVDLKPLTLNSHAGKVDSMNNDASTTQTAATRETTGSAVVRLLEKVHQRIRQNHPEVPEVVIVTGAGIGPMGGKWGHFRPEGWMAKDEDSAAHIHEMFMAGETLAKGARQVLQTMLHESGHGLAQVRGIQDTSRQHRWHNKAFLTIAQELGLKYWKPKANPQIGYSEVVLTDETIEEYRDLLDELDREIHLMVRLPGWLGGTVGKDGDDEEGDGGENMPKAPRPPAAPSTNNIKAVCRCEEPNIIRLSRKVLDKGLVRCDECEELFTAA